MDDRELLERAAKAAGLTYRDDLWNESRIQRSDKLWEAWNPLADDGDALRLAVRLELRVGSDGQSLHPTIVCWRAHYDIPHVVEPVGDDPHAATRRAIVRAAAAIGEQHG